MRNLLLASAATMGALLATSGAAHAQAVTPVAPGTIVVHVHGYLQAGVDASGSTLNTSYNSTTVGSGATAHSVLTSPTNKLNPVAMNGDVRLFFGFDAATLNNVDYGAQLELRTTFSDPNAAASKNASPTSSSYTGNDTIYVKRAYGYVGNPTYGYIRLGQGDSAFSLLQTGVIEAFGDGSQWNAGEGTESEVLPSHAVPGEFAYADQGALYGTNKIVFLSPAIAEPVLGGNFNAGVGFEPNSNGMEEGYGNCASASSTCASLVSTSSALSGVQVKMRKDTVDAAIEYSLKANGFNTKASVGFLYGSPIHYTGAYQTGTSGSYVDNASSKLENLQVFEAGLQTTYAGFTLGGNIKAGQTLDGYVPQIQGTRDAITYVISGNYVIGPFVVGSSFYAGDTAGAFVPTVENSGKTGVIKNTTVGRTLAEYGVAVGGNYVIGKDLSLYVQYLYGHEHQLGNKNLNPSGNGGTAANINAGGAGNAQAQAIGVGATFKW
jgi:hypothetical protein